ncbi:MAG TPA: hypothetical protein VJ652_16465 [Noviherbaspirillum sp.]|nr:hypothetical protein [Noviherbaspirillum sp.]
MDDSRLLAYALSNARADIECNCQPMHRYDPSERRVYSMATLKGEDAAALAYPVELLVANGWARVTGDEIEILVDNCRAIDESIRSAA